MEIDTHTPYATGDTIRLDDYALHAAIGAALVEAGHTPSAVNAYRVALWLARPWWARLWRRAR